MTVLASVLMAQESGEARRWALVVGVSDYADPSIADLRNTVNDARTIGAALKDMGFRVYFLENAGKEEVRSAAARIAAEEGDAELGLFYFAGHGVQVEGVNYLLPPEVRLDRAESLTDDAMSINGMMADLAKARPQNLVVVLDSCRNSPFADREASGTGLALVDAPPNTIVAFSTAPGAVALDGAGANSPFTSALASALVGESQDFRDVLKLVRARVRLATKGAQTPWFVDNSKGEMPIEPREPVPLDVAAEAALGQGITLQATAWRNITESADPRDFAEFARLFPDSPLAEAASRQVAQLGGDTNSQIPRMDLGVPDPAPDVPGGLQATATECDILATRQNDVMALVEPVPHDLVNTRAALRACVAAVADDPENPRLLGLLAWVLRLEGRYEEAGYYYRKAAEAGNPNAWGNLGELYRQGLGFPVDLAAAADAVRRGAMLGAAPVRVQMAVYYREGWGVPQSFGESRRWLELAAMNGNASALTALGDLYRRGQGVTKDYAKSLTYYRQAAALGHSDAVNLVGMAYMRGQGVDEDTATGLRWLTQATDLGNPYSAFYLGRAFLTGWGVDPDLKTALAYFRLSAQRNYLGAYTFIGDIQTADDSGAERNIPEGYANYIIAREAAKMKGTIDSQEELADVEKKIADLLPKMTEDERTQGERIASEWIAQYGLLDFNLVHE